MSDDHNRAHDAHPSGPGAAEAFRYAWSLARRDFGGVILPLATGLFLVGSINVGMNFALLPLRVAAGVKAGVGEGMGVAALMDAAIAIPAVALTAFFGAGFLLFSSDLVRGQRPGFGRIFSGGAVFGGALIATLGTLGLPSIILPLLRLIPFVGSAGLLLTFAGGMAWPWAMAIAVERRTAGASVVTLGWAEAFKAPGTSLLIMLLGGSGILACCLGVFVTMPLMYIAVTYVHLIRKGEIPVTAQS